MNRLDKKAIIVVQLVEESAKELSEKIEKEIFVELSKDLPKIPWFKEVEKALRYAKILIFQLAN